MSRRLESDVVDWVKWFYEHKDDGGDVHKKIEFLTCSIDGLLGMLALAVIDIRVLEGRGNDETSIIMTPNQVKYGFKG